MSRAKRCNPHKYHRIDLGFANAWACANSDCTHYMPPNLNKLMEGKKSICWECGEEFILDIDNMKLDKPICNSCRIGVNEDEAPLTEALEELLRKVN